MSFIDIAKLLKKSWWIVLLSAFLVAVAAALISWFTYKPIYKSNITVYVDAGGMNNASSIGEQYDEVRLAVMVLKNYVEILNTTDFMEEVSNAYQQRFPEAYEQRPYTAVRLLKSTEFKVIEGTYVFNVSISTPDKELSYNLAQIFSELSPQKIFNITGKDSIKIADSARMPYSASNSRHMARNTLLGFIIGAIISFFIIFIADITDVRIKKEEDIINIYPFPLLGTIPNFDTVSKKKGYGYGKK